MLQYSYVAVFVCCSIRMLQCSYVAIFVCCSICMLQYSYVAVFICCSIHRFRVIAVFGLLRYSDVAAADMAVFDVAALNVAGFWREMLTFPAPEVIKVEAQSHSQALDVNMHIDNNNFNHYQELVSLDKQQELHTQHGTSRLHP